MPEELYIKIAVISDLHCQKEENSSKVTRLHTQLLDNPPNKNPVESLKNTILLENKKVDYFLVLGDIANKADIDGFIFGMKLIKEINDVFDAKKLICTVGNHDMYRNSDRQDPENIMRNTNGFPFLFKSINTNDIETKFWSDGFCIIEDEKCIFLVLNSSKYIVSSESKAIEITESLIYKIEQELVGFKETNKLKIALTHHHPIPHSDFNDKYTSLDCLEYGDRLTEMLNRNNFSIFLHGHKHFPRIKTDDNLPIFCSGSFSSLENTYTFNEDNTTHFIDIYKRGNSFIGTIETWIFNERSGWKQSTDLQVRFPTITGFGLNLDIENLAGNIYNNFFKPNENTKDIYIPIYYDSIIKTFPDLKFLSINQQQEFEKILFDKYLITINLNKQSLKKTFVKNFNN